MKGETFRVEMKPKRNYSITQESGSKFGLLQRLDNLKNIQRRIVGCFVDNEGNFNLKCANKYLIFLSSKFAYLISLC